MRANESETTQGKHTLNKTKELMKYFHWGKEGGQLASVGLSSDSDLLFFHLF